MLERRNDILAPVAVFARRLATSIAFSAGLMLGALMIGVAGYHWIGRLPWIDALLNASMILGGMGPVDNLHSNAAKMFASFYALFSGLVFIGAMSIALSPIVHRMLHRFHIDEDDIATQNKT